MKNLVFCTFLSTCLLALSCKSHAKRVDTRSRTLTHQFHYSITGHPDGKNELDGVSIDKDGNSFVGGPFQNRAMINGKLRKAKNGTDIYVAKLDKNGNELWFVTHDSGGNDFMYDLTTDSKGDVLISGSIDGEITQKHGVSVRPDGIAYFAKLSGQNGKLIWRNVISGGQSGGNEIAVDSDDNVIGTLMGTNSKFVFGSDVYTGSGSKDSFILKYSPEGQLLWSFPFLGYGSKQLRAIGVNGKNEIIFGHEYFGEIKVGNNTFNSSQNTIAQGIVGALSPRGSLKWVKEVTSPGFANVRGAGGNSKGDFYFTGVVTGQGMIDNLTLKSPDRRVSFVTKVSSAGDIRWVRLLYGENEDRGGELVVDAKGNVVFGASTNSINYNLYNRKSKLLKSNLINTVHAPIYRAATVILNDQGKFLTSYNPLSSGGSLTGVLEADPNNSCYLIQHRFLEFFEHPNGVVEEVPEGYHSISASRLCLE